MDYKEFLDTIYQRHSSNVKLGLERMEKVLTEMGSPHRHLDGFHVAGTNGKGSTSAMCEHIALHHGLSTGLNTSPHLVDYRERFRINGENILLDELMRIYHQWQKTFDESEASFFEITTAIAFYYFREQGLDTSVFEVGLGGRLDGTNPFIPTVSIITGISIDHPKSLGDTIELIAFEKAGIIKSGIPVVLGEIVPAAREVILEQAELRGAPVDIYGQDFVCENVRTTLGGTVFDYHSDRLRLNDGCLNLLGSHQAHNASVAIRAGELYFRARNLELKPENIRSALSGVNWAGRMQIVRRRPTVILDGAHNEEGVANLVRNLSLLFPAKKLYFVLAILRDKKLDRMIEDVCTIATKVYISKNQSDRAADIQEQAEVARGCGMDTEIGENVVETALTAIRDAGEEGIVIVSGSLYTIAEILPAVQEGRI